MEMEGEYVVVVVVVSNNRELCPTLGENQDLVKKWPQYTFREAGPLTLVCHSMSKGCRLTKSPSRLREHTMQVGESKGWREFVPDHKQLQCQGGWTLFFRSHQVF